MNKQEIYDYLKEKNIWHEITEHEAVYNMKELSQIDIPYPEGDAKNLFLRDDKKRNYYIITVKGYKRVNLKEFRQKNNTRSLSFASENDLMRVMNLIPGSVTPLGILNDKEIKVEVFIDEDFIESPGLIGIHPNDNTATVWLKTEDLINIIKEHGNKVNIVQI
ncbi:prolyl-tRNA synthetase associated domain-containing protein [Paraclostridium dentum]|uniref:prolyl-tRNA synthetase associated domain-containing protein n=1 Tax=Paraclostridium dentum TaxID=2662455 RepID=UPI001472A1DE|nr:prolyl-tRNA synthetase associated domain-containing protein [Paraclostridium dentum]